MASDIVRSADFKTPEQQFAFTKGCFELQEMENGKKQWTAVILIPKNGGSLAPYEAALVDAAKGKWGDKALQMIKDKIIKSPILDGDGPQGKSKKTGETHKGFAGHWFIRLASGEDYRPKVVDRRVNPVLDPLDFPSGSRGFAMVNAYAWEHPKSGKGLSFGFSSIQVSRVATGDEVLGGGGGPAPESVYEKLDDEGDAPDSTKTGDGAAGLFN